MAQLLDEQISFLGQQVEGLFPIDGGSNSQDINVAELETALSVAVNLFDLLRRRSIKACPPGQWREEEARRLVPEYQQWLRLGERLLGSLRRARSLGRLVDGKDAFMRALMECKPIATDFDSLVASHKRWLSGDRSGFRPVSELLDQAR